MATLADARSVEAAVLELKQLLGSRASDAAAIRDHHSHGESYHPPALPDVVCLPHTTDEVASILRVSAAHQIPVVPFGAGTSLEGHVHAVRGGITIDLREMKTILRIGVEDLDATVQAGVTRVQLNKALGETGLMFSVDPGADATMGGMASTRAAGTTTVRYGTMRENVLGLTVVLADGRVIRTGSRARKSAAGYDLTRLFVGAEGTLGVIADVTVRLHPVPEAVAAAVCAFDSMAGAVATVVALIQLGIPVARLELLDEVQMDAVNRYSKTDYPVAPTLLFEFHSDSRPHVEEQAQAVEALATEHGGHRFEWETRLEDRERLWLARHQAMYAALALRPGARAWTTDVCVPISRLAECITETHADNAGAPFPIALVGHAGDGNFHLNYLIDPSSQAEIDHARRINDRLVMRALAMGGTCTGEHGIGYGKMKFLELEHGPAAVEVMRALKRALDPDNRMNPGKMVLI
ncbi:MAG: lactate dehydrogenase [Acidobacteria bacterium RIFCSPLOWO2_12_FULL_65_11]|nr:MAG: lactate dehydrogenase [Acidobacteria bacterium RIFCSPLOWO2_02_FULL_64_15]OFW32654.1 MAG: lactate dehydrogenase [Acidobacteria bacterium RIFCSPLOWO2_12_FULL_65_11]